MGWQGKRMAATGMFGMMLCRLAGIIVMDRAIGIMMMLNAFQMLHLMRDVKRTACRRPAALHGKAVQRQEYQQENTKETTHDYSGEKFVGILYDFDALVMSCLPSQRPLGPLIPPWHTASADEISRRSCRHHT